MSTATSVKALLELLLESLGLKSTLAEAHGDSRACVTTECAATRRGQTINEYHGRIHQSNSNTVTVHKHGMLSRKTGSRQKWVAFSQGSREVSRSDYRHATNISEIYILHHDCMARTHRKHCAEHPPADKLSLSHPLTAATLPVQGTIRRPCHTIPYHLSCDAVRLNGLRPRTLPAHHHYTPAPLALVPKPSGQTWCAFPHCPFCKPGRCQTHPPLAMQA